MTRFGLGCATFVSKARGVPEDEARRILEAAYDEWIDFLDTAHMYGAGRSESLIGEVLGHRRDALTLCTKIGVHLADPTDTSTMVVDSRTDALLRQVDESLARLRTDHVDMVLLHQPDPARSPQEQMESLAVLRERGLARRVGFSNFPAEACTAALSTGVPDAVEYSLNLIDDRNVGQLRAAGEHGLLRISFGTFAHGLLAEDLSLGTEFGPGDWRRRSRATGDARTSGNVFFAGAAYEANLGVADALRRIGREYGFTLGDIAVVALAELGLTDVVLLGCRSVAELRSNLAGAGRDLPPDAARAVRDALAACPTAPVPA